MISKRLLAKIALIFIIGSSIILPMVALAAQDANGNPVQYTAPPIWPTGYWGPLVSCTGSFIPTANPSPSPTPGTAGKTPPTCTNLCDLIGTLINIIYFAISVAVFIVTPILFVVGALMVMVSGANPEMLGRGKKVLTSTAIGVAIVLCSYLIVATFIKVLNVVGVGGFNISACSVNPNPTSTK